MTKPATVLRVDMAISQIIIGKRRRKDAGDLASLSDSLKTVGMLHPVILNGQLELVSGGRRLAAAKKLGWISVPVSICRTLNEQRLALRAEYDENTCRKDFTPEEAVKIGEEVEVKIKQESKNELGVVDSATPNSFAESGRVTKIAAESVGMKRARYEGAKKVVAAAKENPALRPVVEKMNETGNVSAAVREVAEIMEDETPGEPEELTPLSKAVAGLEKLKTLTRQLRNAAKEVFVFDESKCPTAPYLTRFTWVSVIGMLNDYLTMLEAGTPTGGTVENPDTKRSDQMRKALKK